MSYYAEAKRRLWGAPIPPGIKHGPNTFASKVRGCDCKKCLPSGRRIWVNREEGDVSLTHLQRQKKLRDSKKNTPVPAGAKHGVYAYRIYNCRCDVCRATVSGAAKRQANAWREFSRGRWTTTGDSETICWPPKNAGPDWVCPGCGSSSHPNKKEVA